MNEQDVVSFFTGKGYEPHQAAGIAGNLMQESTLNPTAKNPTSGAFGLAQWLGSRKKSFMDFALKNKKDIKDPTAQLEFIDHELNTTETRARDKLLNSKDATEAAFNFSNHYERAGANEKKNATRASYANRILSSIVPSAQAGENMADTTNTDGTEVYKVRDPSGVLRKIRGPAGATDDEIITQAKLLFPSDESKGLQFNAGKAVSNIPTSFGNLVTGTVEALTHPQDIVKTAAGGLYNLSQAIPGKATPVENRYTSAVKPDQAFMQDAVAKANAVGGVYKERYGSPQKFLTALETDPAAVAADISILFTGGASAARNLGAAGVANKLAVASNVTNPFTLPVIAAQKAAPIITKPASAITNYISGVADPKATALLAASEGRGADIINALRNNPEIVSGSIPTAGQAAAPANASRFSALQQDVAKFLPTQYLERTNAQNAAFERAAERVAKSPEEISTMIKERSATTKPMYAAAKSAGDVVDTTPIIAKIDDLIAKNPGNPELLTEFNRIRGGLVDAQGVPRTNAQEVSSAIDGVKSALAKKENAYIKSELTSVKDDLTSAIPGYEKAQKTFAELSKPINQAEVGAYLKKKLIPSLGAESANLKKSSFATAMEEAPLTIENATTGSPFKKLEDILTPKQFSEFDNILTELKRQEKFEKQARAGSKAGETIPVSPIGNIPNWLNKVVTAANMVISRLEGKISRKLAMDLAVEMLNPERAATELTKAMERQASMQQRGAAITGAGAKILQGAKSPTGLAAGQVNNALSNQENRNALAQ
jgi:hypothetical protein